jgi:hypothetical protein
MIISIVNHTDGQVSDEDLQRAIRAINRQIQEDFEPYWGMSARLRLEGRSVAQPETAQLADMRGDAVIYLWNEADVEDAIGYHFENNRGVPFGFVFTEIAREIGEAWSVTLSHEALELIGDPETNLLVMGPHPDPSEHRDVFHWFEMCDAVQAESYEVDGVEVSNFLLPLYFTGSREADEVGARNDFLGRAHDGRTLVSFGINPGGYVGFFDPETGKQDSYSLRGDRLALRRFQGKLKAKEARRAVRYRSAEIRERLQRRAAATRGRRALIEEAMPIVSLTQATPAGSGPRREPVNAGGAREGGRSRASASRATNKSNRGGGRLR